MRIGIIGSGNIGATAAQLFARAGHDVAISNSRGPETLQELVDNIGPNVRAVTVEEAAEFGEVVLEAIPFGRYKELPVEPLAGRWSLTPRTTTRSVTARSTSAVSPPARR